MKHNLVWLSVAVFALSGCSDVTPSKKATQSRPPVRTTSYLEDGTPALKKKPDRVTVEAREFFAEWLTGHGEQQVVSDETGVGLKGQKTRLWAFNYGATGENSVELEFRIVLPDGREIVEFLGGFGPTEQDAINLTFGNFILSTFHVVYSCMMNEDDPHLTHEPIDVSGHPFLLTTAGFVTMGDGKNANLVDANESLRQSIRNVNLSDQLHWGKVVYTRDKDQVLAAAFTLDNENAPVSPAELATWNWPSTESFYMTKQFFILRPVPQTKSHSETVE